MLGREEVTNQPVSLKELLVKATLSPSVAIDQQYPQIDLGVFSKEAEGMLQRSLMDPQKRERGKMVLITQKGDVQIQQEDDVGEHTKKGNQVGGSVVIKVAPNRENLPRAQKQLQFLGMIIHDHPEDQAVNAADIADLLRTENSIRVAPAILVISPTQKTLYTRCNETPQLSDTEVDKIIEAYEKEFFAPRKMLGSAIGQIANINLQKARDQLDAFRLTSDLCRKYNIYRYSCPINRNTVTPYSA